MIKKCIFCGQEFEAVQPQEKLCSKECRRLRFNEKARAAKARVMQDSERKARKNQKQREWYANNKNKCRQWQQNYYKRKCAEELLRAVKCIVCGQEFETRDGRQKICSDSCRLIQKRKWQRKYYEAYRQKVLPRKQRQEILPRKQRYENKDKVKSRRRELRRDRILENRLATAESGHGLEFWHDLKKINLDEEYWNNLKSVKQWGDWFENN